MSRVAQDDNVEYCKDCLSLLTEEMGGMVFCSKCGSTNIGNTSIMSWEAFYESKYGHKLLDEPSKHKWLRKRFY